MDETNYIQASADVHGEQCKVTLYRMPGKKSWTASGSYRGQPVAANGGTPQAARDHWESKARMIGDVP